MLSVLEELINYGSITSHSFQLIDSLSQPAVKASTTRQEIKITLTESSISHLFERDYAKPPNRAESQIFLNAIKAEGELNK